MRVLVANKFWYLRGGLERVMFDEVEWLVDSGHDVAHFSTTHPNNMESEWSDYFAPYVELGEGSSRSATDAARAAVAIFSNREAARRFGRLLADFRPDVVHLHGIHRQLTPSILVPALECGVPVVQTLHDYHHICPADTLNYAGREACEPRRCGVFWYGPAVKGRCLRGSLSATAVSAAETTWARVTRAYAKTIRLYVCPSRFMAERMREARWQTPMRIVPNAVRAPSSLVPQERRERLVYVGRLAPEKGVEYALEAARRTGRRLVVAGDGPLWGQLRREFPEAEFLGHVEKRRLTQVLSGAMALLVPSLSLENAPMTILESMAAGVPVIASRAGGIPEQIEDGVTGLLVPPRDANAIAKAVECIMNEELAAAISAAAHDAVRTRFSPEQHMDGLMAAYSEAGVGG